MMKDVKQHTELKKLHLYTSMY